MKWFVRLFVASAILALVVGAVGMVYVVRAKFVTNDYYTQISLAFNAAMLVNAHETYTDEACAIIAETENGRFVIAPENYPTLSFYLKVQAAMPFLEHVDKDAPLKISICSESMVYVEPDDGGDGANLRFVTADDAYTMHVSDPELWEELIHTCESGTTRAENIPLN